MSAITLTFLIIAYLLIGWLCLFILIYLGDSTEPSDEATEYLASAAVFLFWPLGLVILILTTLVRIPLVTSYRISKKLKEKDDDQTISKIV